MKKSRLFIIISTIILVFLVVSCRDDEEMIDIHFDTQGGSRVPSMRVSIDKQDQSLPQPTKEGYTFRHWSLTPENGVAFDQDYRELDESFVTLYAVWEPDQYTITYILDHGAEPIIDRVTHGEMVELHDPSIEGYFFAGWYDGIMIRISPFPSIRSP